MSVGWNTRYLPSSDFGEAEEDEDGDDVYINLHISDMPDAPASAGNSHSSDVPSYEPNNVATRPPKLRSHKGSNIAMGANNSKEEVNAAIRATAAELQDRKPPQASRGKLRSIRNNPQHRYENPATRSHDRIRSLRPNIQARHDPYDLLASPEQTTRLGSKRPFPSQPISPLRIQKALKQVALPAHLPRSLTETYSEDQQAQREPNITVTPRRSPRKKTAEGMKPAAEASRGKAQTSQTPKQEIVRIKDEGRPASSARNPAGNVGQAAAGDEDGADEAETYTYMGQQVNGSAKAPRKGGRPRKIMPTHDPHRNKGGRPRKSTSHAMQEQIGADERPDSDTQVLRPEADVRSTAARAEIATRTRAQTTASLTARKQATHNSARAQRSLNTRAHPKDHEPTSAGAEEQRDDVAVDIDVAQPLFVSEGGNMDLAADANEDEEDGQLPDQPLSSRRPERVRPSQMIFPNENEEGQLANDDAKARPQLSRKRKASPAANSSRQRRRFVPQPTRGPASDEDGNDGQDDFRIFGQWRTLKKVFEVVRDVDGDPPEDDEIGAIVNLCKKAVKRLAKLKDHRGSITPDLDPCKLFDELSERVDTLTHATEESTPDFNNRLRGWEIYSHVFPSITKLLESTIICYEAIDQRQDVRATMSMNHVRFVNEFISVILELKEYEKYPKPATEERLVLPIRNGVTAPLKRVRRAFEKVLQEHEREERSRAEAEREAGNRALRLQREQQKQRRAQEVEKRRKDWHRLHVERRWAEACIIGRQKLQHLCTPDPKPELDHNGQPFERIEVFEPRIGPLPAMVEAAREHMWSMAEIDALTAGLKEYHGPEVFMKIFRRHCRRYGLLHRYSVTEIVTTAADIKVYLMNKQQGLREEVEDWIRSIPEWTQGRSSGKENEEDQIVPKTEDM